MVTISRAQNVDMEAIAALEKRIFSDAMSVKTLAASMEKDIFLVIRDGDHVIGYFLGQSVLDEMEVLRIAVSPEERRKGYGRKLLQAVREEAIRQEIGQCFLEVRESNAGARSLYLSFGFSECGRRARFYRQPDEDAILMKTQWSAELT